MPITPKPDKILKTESSLAPSEEAIKAIINRGGAVPESFKKQEEEVEDNTLKRVQLRLKSEWLNEIDTIRKQRSKMSVPSRHNWIIEAIAEKLEREKSLEI